MKKAIMLTSAALFGIVMMTGCSKDKSVSESESKTYSSENVNMTLGAGIVSGADAEVTVMPRSGQSAMVVFKNVFPGVAHLPMGDFRTVKDADSVILTHGSYALNDNYRIDTLYGSIKSGIVTLKADMTCISPIAKTWNLSASESPLLLNYESKTGKTVLNFGDGDMEMDDPTYAEIYKMMGGMVVYMYLQSVTFLPDGNLTAKYKAGENWVESPKGMVTYMIADGKIYLKPNMSALMGLIPGGSLDMTTIPEGLKPLINMALGQGIPLNYTLADKSLKVLAATELVQPLGGLIGSLADQIPADNPMVEMVGLEYVKGLVNGIATGITNSTKYEIGLNLEASEKTKE